MKITIQRYCTYRKPEPKVEVEYEIPLMSPTLLEALSYIKTNIDQTLTFDSGCRSEVCGSCAVRVNDKEKLSCGYKLQDGDVITPLSKLPVIKDLVVEVDASFMTLVKTRAFLEEQKVVKQTSEDEKLIERQSDCILCNSCFSSCPVLEVNKEFLGPFALTRVLRYTNDKRCEDEKQKIDLVQQNGIWDCTLCGECTAVCPQNINPKMDIMNLRAKSAKYGYMDPNFGGGLDFGAPSF